MGTDHGEANVMFVGGGSVNGGVFNCDAATWPAGSMYERRGRYLGIRTDFRAVFAEIFQQHFGAAAGLMDTIFPGFTFDQGDYPAEFAPLNFLT